MLMIYKLTLDVWYNWSFCVESPHFRVYLFCLWICSRNQELDTLIPETLYLEAQPSVLSPQKIKIENLLAKEGILLQQKVSFPSMSVVLTRLKKAYWGSILGSVHFLPHWFAQWLLINFESAKHRTRDGWLESTNATSVLCLPQLCCLRQE